jgi:hypothetical protein
MGGELEATQNLRQLARGELAGSARAVAELGEAPGSVGSHSGRIYRWCSGYLTGAGPQAFLAASRR